MVGRMSSEVSSGRTRTPARPSRLQLHWATECRRRRRPLLQQELRGCSAPLAARLRRAGLWCINSVIPPGDMAGNALPTQRQCHRHEEGTGRVESLGDVQSPINPHKRQEKKNLTNVLKWAATLPSSSI